jgi:ankyrin repeat protein
MIQALQQKGVKLTNNALLMAAQGTRRDANTVDVFNYLIDGQKLSPAVKDKEGNTLLQLVAKKQKQEEVAAYLISKGVPVNAATANGETALTMAMAYGSSSMVALLLDNKADINVVDKKGYNLTHYLMQSFRAAGSRGGMRGGPGAPPAGMAPNNGSPAKDEFAEKMKILQDRHFNLIAPQKDGSTILHYAATAGDLALVKKVVAMGVSLNAQNDDGMTALVKAASTAKDDKVLRYLVEAGADKTLKTSFDESAYDLVKNNENFKKNNIDIEFLK